MASPLNLAQAALPLELLIKWQGSPCTTVCQPLSLLPQAALAPLVFCSPVLSLEALILPLLSLIGLFLMIAPLLLPHLSSHVGPFAYPPCLCLSPY